MADILVHRPARSPAEHQIPGPVPVSPPPALDDAARISNWTYALFPLLGSAGILVFALVNGNPLYLVAGGVFVLGAIGMGAAMFIQMRGRSREQRSETRLRYFSHLADARVRLRAATEIQRAAARAQHPEPAGLASVVNAPDRLWERRPDDSDFLLVRVGRGLVPAVAAPQLGEPDPMRPADPAGEQAARRLVDTHAMAPDVPVAVSLARGVTTLVGEPGPARSLARAMLCQLAALHAPDDVRVAVCCPAGARAREEWDWVKWLPHVHHPTTADGDGSGLLLATDTEQLAELLRAELDRRRSSARAPGTRIPAAAAAGPALLVVVDGAVEPPDPLLGADELGVSLLRLVPAPEQQPSHVDLSLRISASPGGGAPQLVPVVRDPSEGHSLAGVAQVRPDGLSVVEAETLARRLAPLRLSRQLGEVALSEVSGLPELLGLPDVAKLDPQVSWQRRSEHDLLRVPLGVDVEGRPVELDLKESALSGMGPHGLAVGATGSGKSELLRTLVTGLAVTHAPEELAFVLVDFKGGAAFDGLAALPHVAGLITDLEDDPDTIERVGDALRGELRRREELLRDSGLDSIREHRQRRLAGGDVPRMPHLLVVVDEFSELLVQQPEFINLFVAIGRRGRSLGVHLLLATQRLEEGRLRGLEGHLSYRLALRTLNAQESRTVIGNADAFELPEVPGSVYLKVGTSRYDRFRVSTVSAPYIEPALRRTPSAPPRPRIFRGFPAVDQAGAHGARAEPNQPRTLPAIGLDLSDPDQRSTLDVIVSRLTGAAEPVHQVWLPPLPTAIPLAAILPGLTLDPARGLGTPTNWEPTGSLRVPLCVVDLPDQQHREVLAVDLSGAGGHVGVAGAPQTGKSTVLRTLVTSLAVTHTPTEVQVYCLDLGGGVLAGLEALPQVGGVAGRQQPERVRRAVAQLTALVDERERWFSEHGINSVAAFRAGRARGELPDDGYGDVVLVVDGWMALRSEFEDLEARITQLANRGLGYGLHVVVSASRWWDIRPALRDSLGTKLELKIGDSADSVFDRKVARTMPADMPGRMLVPGGHKAQAALPHLAPAPAPASDGPRMAEDPAITARRIAEAWTGPPALPIRLLPARVDLADLPDPAADREPGAPIGLRESDLRPAYLDLLAGRDPHLVVLGDSGSGKTAVLRTLLATLTARYTPEQLRMIVVDYRRTLLDVVGEEHLSVYCGSAPAANQTVAAAASKLAARLPGPDVTSAQLRARNWWTGPHMLVVVDDYDLVATSSGDRLQHLVELLPQGRDIGLHLVVARSVGGAGAAGMQSVLRRLRELGSPGLLLSGSREEGVLLHGVRAQPLPPGRGQLVSRQQPPQLVQVAWAPEVGAD